MVVRFCGIGAGYFRKRPNNKGEVSQKDCINAGERQLLRFNIENPTHGIAISIPKNPKHWPQGTDSVLK